MKNNTQILAFGLAILLLFPLFLAAADSPSRGAVPVQDDSTAGGELGYGVGSVLASIFYSPAKITYAGIGLLAGGLGYVVTAGRSDVANNIIYPAIGGDYVITPGHLKGKEPVAFIGPPPAPDAPERQSAAPPATAKR
jgi:hypothetical protein